MFKFYSVMAFYQEVDIDIKINPTSLSSIKFSFLSC